MTNERRRAGIAQFEATVILIVVSLSLASVVYGGLKKETNLSPQAVFANTETSIGGSPPLELVAANASSTTTVTSMSFDQASSTTGVLAFDGSSYSTSVSLCSVGVTTFFSVLSPQSGTLKVTTNGRAWVAGTYGSAVAVGPGWQEIMIQSGTTCSITLPGGQQVPTQWNQASPLTSSVPTQGPPSSSAFSFYVPAGGGAHRLLITTTGGFDAVAL